MAIGFSAAPEKIDETWTKEHCGRTYIFTKTRKGPHHFVYNCKRHHEDGRFTGESSTGVILDHELTRDEVERRPQFVKFMNEREWKADAMK
jgi:hypothetical protein